MLKRRNVSEKKYMRTKYEKHTHRAGGGPLCVCVNDESKNVKEYENTVANMNVYIRIV